MRKIACVLIGILILAGCGAAPCYSEIVKSMGYDAETEPSETETIVIPEKFNDVYEKYNALQREGGFDLEPYRGKTCTRYTYLIPSLDARANILVYENRVIGGDICGITLDGFMIPLRK